MMPKYGIAVDFFPWGLLMFLFYTVSSRGFIISGACGSLSILIGWVKHETTKSSPIKRSGTCITSRFVGCIAYSCQMWGRKTQNPKNGIPHFFPSEFSFRVGWSFIWLPLFSCLNYPDQLEHVGSFSTKKGKTKTTTPRVFFSYMFKWFHIWFPIGFHSFHISKISGVHPFNII